MKQRIIYDCKVDDENMINKLLNEDYLFSNIETYNKVLNPLGLKVYKTETLNGVNYVYVINNLLLG